MFINFTKIILPSFSEILLVLLKCHLYRIQTLEVSLKKKFNVVSSLAE